MGDIDLKYAEPGTAERLGAALGSETAGPDGGLVRRYERGMITWHPMAGAHTVHGATSATYAASGGPGGPLGYPITDGIDVWRQRGGQYQDFMDGQIYAQPELGAHAVSGGIFEKFLLQDALGGAGYPIGGRRIEADGTVVQDFEHLTLTWNPDLGAGTRSRRQAGRTFLRVLPVAFRDIPPPTGMTRSFLEAYFFGRGIDLRMPDGGHVTESLAEYFARISYGLITLEGVVEDWFVSERECHRVAHWIGGGVWPAGDAGLTGEFAAAMRNAGIRDARSMRVRGREVDAVYFLHTDMLSNGGATRTFEDFRHNLGEHGRLDLWEAGWDSFAEMPFSTSGLTLQHRQDINPRTSRFDEPPRPGEIVHAPQSTARHELLHVLGPFGNDIYGLPYRFGASWHEVMGYVIRTDGPIGITSLVGERLGLLSPVNLARRSHDRYELRELESHRTAARFPNGPLRDPEYLVLEHRRRFDLDQPAHPRLPGGIVAYAIDPRERTAVDTIEPLENGDPDHVGRRAAGTMIRRNGSPGSAFGLDPKGSVLGPDGPFDRSTLNHAGEAWWAFTSMVAGPDGARFSARYQADDLIDRVAEARWTAADGAFVGGRLDFRPGPISVLQASGPAETGEPFGRTIRVELSRHGPLTGTFDTVVPASGARLYLTVVLAAPPPGADDTEIRVTASVPRKQTSPAQVELGRMKLHAGSPDRTLVVDLSAYAGRRIQLGIAFGAVAGKAGGAAVLVTEASIVPMARVLVDLLTGLDRATFRAGPTRSAVTLGADHGRLGAARRDGLVDLHDGRTYAGPSLHLHPQWEPDGWVEASWPVALPATAAVLRVHAGFDARRTTVANGVDVSLRFEGPERELVLLGRTRLDRAPAFGRRGAVRNRPLVTAIPIPEEFRSQPGNLCLRVDAGGDSGQDWFHVVSARITAN